MEECTSRVLEVWRRYIPNKAYFDHKARVKRLESYLHDVIQKRYKDIENGIEHDDILEKMIRNMQVYFCV